MLEDLYRQHLFVDRRYETEVMYQFHALFRAFLLHRLEQSVAADDCIALKRRAAVLLESERRMDEALALYIEAEDWAAVTSLVLREAPALLGQGRSQALRDWIEAMPQDWIVNGPWLSYWLGQSWIGKDLQAARVAFEQAHCGLRSQSDIEGQVVAIAGIMETYYFVWSKFAVLDAWIAEMCRLLELEPIFSNAEMELRAYGALLLAAHYRAPRSPWLSRAVERIRALLDADLSDDRKVRAGCTLLGYAHAASDLSLGLWVVSTVGPMVERAHVTPLSRCMWLGRLGLHLAHKGAYEEAIAAVDQADALASDRGIRVDVALRAFWGVMATLNGGDLVRAEAFVDRLETVASPDRGAEIGMVHYCRCMIASRSGGSSRRLGAWVLGGPDRKCRRRLLAAGQLHRHCDLRDDRCRPLGRSNASYARAANVGRRYAISPRMRPSWSCVTAALALASGNHGACHRHLRQAGQIARSTGYIFFNRAMPRPLRDVLSEALRAEVDSEYFRRIVRRFGLWPGPDGDEGWPWPVRLRVLGSFELLIDGAPPSFSRKMPRKTLALLCVIIAFGGSDVAEDRILTHCGPRRKATLPTGRLPRVSGGCASCWDAKQRYVTGVASSRSICMDAGWMPGRWSICWIPMTACHLRSIYIGVPFFPARMVHGLCRCASVCAPNSFVQSRRWASAMSKQAATRMLLTATSGDWMPSMSQSRFTRGYCDAMASFDAPPTRHWLTSDCGTPYQQARRHAPPRPLRNSTTGRCFIERVHSNSHVSAPSLSRLSNKS